jgi:uncharacterized NAD(P)/FAD-binding protein YdhS
MDDIYDIAVAGAGFSGLMVVANIMRGKGPKPRIFWADPESDWGFGLAYSTYESCHLLNVRADRMGAWADGIDDFWRWLQKHHRDAFEAHDFVPRMIYGDYLATIREAFDKVPLEQARIDKAKREGDVWRLNIGKRQVYAKHLVIATGNPPIASLGWPDNPIYIANFWRWRLDGGSAQFVPEDGTIVIAGMGLTAADAVLSVLQDGFKGRIVCVSPHGHWPEVHHMVAPYAQSAALVEQLNTKATALHYLRVLRDHATDKNWRDVVDSLRPHTLALWQALPDTEKARFMRHLWSRWNIHRHRMAPQIRERMTESKQIELIAGRIVETAENGSVKIRLRGGAGVKEVKAALVVNCTGPSYRRMVDENPLLRSLKEQGYVKAGPLGLGIATPDGPGLSAIGTVLLGERFETTAVPDLRGQAINVILAKFFIF